MRIYLSLLVAFLALTNAALGGVGDVGVSDGYNLQPLSSYTAGAAQQGGLASQTPGLQSQDNLVGSTGYPAPQDSSLQPSGFQQPLSGSIPGQYTQTTQMGVPQETSLPFNQGGSVAGQNYQSPQAGYPPVPANQPSSGYQQSNPVNQMSSFASAAPQLSGPYQEHFSPDDLRLSQPQAEVFEPQGSLNFATDNPPSGMLTDTALAPNAVSATAPGYAPSGSWYYPGSTSSRNKFYVQTSSGFKSVAGCSYGGYVPLWANIASSDNFYVYEWYPGQTSPYVRWWGWTWPGWKKGWFSGDVPGWHILCFHCRDWSNYVYIYVWPSAGGVGTAGSGNGPIMPAMAQSSAALPSGAPTPPDPNAENLMLPDYSMISQGQSGNPGQIGYNPSQSGYASQGGYSAQTFKTVFPKPTAYRCNEYYAQGGQGRLNTVGSVKCGEWLPLWSKIGKPGCYWSFEWTQGCTSSGSFCYPEVKNFGYKGTGWYSTWFRGNKPGWHILSYFSNDWSNYIYVYVWSPN
jgi:hypothetical protein